MCYFLLFSLKKSKFVIMSKQNKVLYFHLRSYDDEIFYVGIGNEERAYTFSKSTRSKKWNDYVFKYGKPKVKIIEKNLTIEDASKLEKKYIKLLGRKDLKKGNLLNLTNGGECHSILNKKGISVLCLKNGKIYKSISNYCKERNIPHSNISSFLRGTHTPEKDYNVRIVKNNIVQWDTCFDEDLSINMISLDNIELLNTNEDKDIKSLFKDVSKKHIMIIVLKNLYEKTFSDFQKEFGFDISNLYYETIKLIKKNKKNNLSKRNSSYKTRTDIKIENAYNKLKYKKKYFNLMSYLIE